MTGVQTCALPIPGGISETEIAHLVDAQLEEPAEELMGRFVDDDARESGNGNQRSGNEEHLFASLFRFLPEAAIIFSLVNDFAGR